MKKVWAAAAIVLSFLSVHCFAADAEGWTSLSDLSHWEAYGGGAVGPQWKVEPGGVLHLMPGDGSLGRESGDLVTDRDYESFVLEFEWKVAKGANSGVLYRVVRGDDPPYYSGPEYQVYDSPGDPDETSAAALYGLYPPKGASPKPAGQWNTAKIVVDADKVGHFLNGKKVVTATIGSDDWNTRLRESRLARNQGFDVSRFAATARGRVSLQDHGSEVWYRNVRIKPTE